MSENHNLIESREQDSRKEAAPLQGQNGSEGNGYLSALRWILDHQHRIFNGSEESRQMHIEMENAIRDIRNMDSFFDRMQFLVEEHRRNMREKYDQI